MKDEMILVMIVAATVIYVIWAFKTVRIFDQ
jgi:hypothetical protein